MDHHGFVSGRNLFSLQFAKTKHGSDSFLTEVVLMDVRIFRRSKHRIQSPRGSGQKAYSVGEEENREFGENRNSYAVQCIE